MIHNHPVGEVHEVTHPQGWYIDQGGIYQSYWN